MRFKMGIRFVAFVCNYCAWNGALYVDLDFFPYILKWKWNLCKKNNIFKTYEQSIIVGKVRNTVSLTIIVT